ncbi:ferrous iron transport protein B [Pseudoalteromonas ardens]|uniref:Ferrous iron transport protein B n=1 Tax=Pseudoalteromonas rubra TaxID=43658 RepID=A0A0L0EQY1_9GAMM|nr:ferrous iron transport protein B [Pseudoalteromonas sp. R96]KNC66298.1 iron transporter FeoB [Pseudoalteromonas rubra]MDK1313043.1 ferrous iron transport protein B [Pseudoalteromonas sp. R96]
MRIALVGNPNCGKTTLFNRLTGARQKVGNWPGVTVERKSGELSLPGQQVELIDLPGLYSMAQIDPGQDEQIAIDYICAQDADLIINVIDCANLERNLVLTTQMQETGTPLIVVANMTDVAHQQGKELDLDLLAQRLGVPVIAMVGSTGQGLTQLTDALSEHCTGKPPQRRTQQAPNPDPSIEDTVKRFQNVKTLSNGVSIMSKMRSDFTTSLDKLVLNRWLGVPIFLFMMYLTFTIAVNFGAVFIDFFDILIGAIFIDGTKLLLANLGAPQWLGVLLGDGFGAGLQLVATFIPVIAVLYFCLSILEDSGYLSRAAFVIDRLMSAIGLPGNAFVPLIVGFGCNVPAVMSARTMSRESDRLLTVIMAPFMSCGARLTVYALFAAAFFPMNGANIVFALYVFGILVAVGTGYLFRKRVFKQEKVPSFVEMPAYHLPVWRNLVMTTWQRLRSFITRAGKTIVFVVTLLSMINSIGTDGSFGHENSEASLLSKTAQVVTPVFAPLGIAEGNWPATVGIVTGLFAKEAIVGTMDALYVGAQEQTGEWSLKDATNEAVMTLWDNSVDLLNNLGDPLGLSAVEEGGDAGNELLSAMAAQFHGQLGAFAYLVLILLYTPCVAVLGAIKRESGSVWMWVVIGWTTSIAYILATLVYQIGQLGTAGASAMMWIVLMLAALFAWWLILGRLSKHLHAVPTYKIELS